MAGVSATAEPSGDDASDIIEQEGDAATSNAVTITQMDSPQKDANSHDVLTEDEIEIAAVSIKAYIDNTNNVSNYSSFLTQHEQETNRDDLYDTIARDSVTRLQRDVLKLNKMVDGTFDHALLLRHISSIFPKLLQVDHDDIVEKLEDAHADWAKLFDRKPRAYNPLAFYDKAAPKHATSFEAVRNQLKQLKNGEDPTPSYDEQYPHQFAIFQFILAKPSGCPNPFQRKSHTLQEMLSTIPIFISMAQGPEPGQGANITAGADQLCEYLGGKGGKERLIELCKQMKMSFNVGPSPLLLPNIPNTSHLASAEALFPLNNPEGIIPSIDEEYMQDLLKAMSPKDRYCIVAFSKFLSAHEVLVSSSGTVLKKMKLDVVAFLKYSAQRYLDLCKRSNKSKKASKPRPSSKGDPDDDDFYYDSGDDDDSDDDESDDDVPLVAIKGKTFSLKDMTKEFAVFLLEGVRDGLKKVVGTTSGLMYESSSLVRSLYGAGGMLSQLGRRIKKEKGVRTSFYYYSLSYQSFLNVINFYQGK